LKQKTAAIKEEIATKEIKSPFKEESFLLSLLSTFSLTSPYYLLGFY
jgi:hypothetical protein